MAKKNIKVNKRAAVFANLSLYCPHADKSDFAEVTEWTNGEGIDINVCSVKVLGNRTITLTYGEFDAVKDLVKILEKRLV